MKNAGAAGNAGGPRCVNVLMGEGGLRTPLLLAGAVTWVGELQINEICVKIGKRWG